MVKKAYKVFNPDWTCRGIEYEVSKTYSIEEKPKICENGFHYCLNLIDCFRYYTFNPNNKVAEVEILGDIDISPLGNKECTNKIKIVRELTWHEVLDLVNIGKDNTGKGNTGNHNAGYYNTGNYNTGYHNTGDYNIGDHNTGDYNVGSYNAGYHNTGDYNTGDYNTGYHNTGDLNTGDYNTGCCNSCNFSTGFFNSVEQPIYCFNKETTLTRNDLFELKGLSIIQRIKLSEWVNTDDMTEEEKQQHPEYETMGGYLKTYTYKQAWTNLWEKLNKDDKQAIKDLPNFDKKVFKEITGITIR